MARWKAWLCTLATPGTATPEKRCAACRRCNAGAMAAMVRPSTRDQDVALPAVSSSAWSTNTWCHESSALFASRHSASECRAGARGRPAFPLPILHGASGQAVRPRRCRWIGFGRNARIATLDPARPWPRRHRGRRRSRHVTAASPGSGPAPSSRPWSRRAHRSRRPLDHAGPDRLPHPPRLRRQPRARVRAASCRRQLRGDRARRRRHSLHREGDARGIRGRAGGAGAAAARRADRRRRHHHRDQVGLRPGAGNRGAPAARRAPAWRRAAACPSRRRFSARTPCRPRPTATRTATSRGCAGRCCRPSPNERLADAVDAFMEGIAFSGGQTARVFEVAKRLGLPVKLHADQLSNLGGANAGGALRRALGRSSGIHGRGGRRRDGQGRHGRGAAAGRVLFHPRDAEAAGRAVPQARHAHRHRHRLQSRLVAPHLAAADHEHGRHAVPPDGRRDHRRRDARGGARAGATASEVGTLEAGKWCDLAIWNVERLAELPYRMGFNPLHQRVWRGQ